ncbi:hypothetical protein OPV22_035200 [Ensete ventricosum]|uniref:Uncharacterized protein n=1 Tax=Ensete ventricosum TaxID=4639 RepID=A0AAX5J491_ENSVE|nr:hypothetical protein OPV22_035200 [Ensete ventricosum]
MLTWRRPTTLRACGVFARRSLPVVPSSPLAVFIGYTFHCAEILGAGSDDHPGALANYYRAGTPGPAMVQTQVKLCLVVNARQEKVEARQEKVACLKEGKEGASKHKGVLSLKVWKRCQNLLVYAFFSSTDCPYAQKEKPLLISVRKPLLVAVEFRYPRKSS